MCGRYFIDLDDISDAELLALLDREKTNSELNASELHLKSGEVRPGDTAAVIAMNRKLIRTAFVMQWGYHFNKRLIINARTETAAERPMFQQSLKNRRCLIPASAYFEWDHREKPLKKYSFGLRDKSMIYLAGLYRFESPDSLPVFTILTRNAAPEISCFHDRMPVIIPGALQSAWLDHQHSATTIMERAITESLVWQYAE